jgi:hypothetical protein
MSRLRADYAALVTIAIDTSSVRRSALLVSNPRTDRRASRLH